MSFTFWRNLCALTVVFALHGCGKKPADAPAPATPKQSTGVSVETPADNAAPPPPAPSPDTTAAPVAAAPVDQSIPVDPGLQAALAKFFNDNARPAQNWKELLDGRYITRIPQGADGKPLDWDKTMQEIGKRR